MERYGVEVARGERAVAEVRGKNLGCGAGRREDSNRFPFS